MDLEDKASQRPEKHPLFWIIHVFLSSLRCNSGTGRYGAAGSSSGSCNDPRPTPL
jgi:hypothetical protein